MVVLSPWPRTNSISCNLYPPKSNSWLPLCSLVVQCYTACHEIEIKLKFSVSHSCFCQTATGSTGIISGHISLMWPTLGHEAYDIGAIWTTSRQNHLLRGAVRNSVIFVLIYFFVFVFIFVFKKIQQEAQLPLKEQGVSHVLSSHHNATPGNLAFLVYSYVTSGSFSKLTWQRTRASLPEYILSIMTPHRAKIVANIRIILILPKTRVMANIFLADSMRVFSFVFA